MKSTNNTWRGQKGTRVRYAVDRVSGTGVIRTVLVPPIHPLEGRYRVRDDITGAMIEADAGQLILLPANKDKPTRPLPPKRKKGRAS